MRSIAATALLAVVGCLDSPPAGTGPGSSCGTVRALRDDLDGELALWDNAGGVQVVGASARFAAPAGAGAALESLAHYQVAGGALAVELDASGLADGLFEVSWLDPDDRVVAVQLADGDLTLQIVDASGMRSVDVLPFGDGAGWWRLREEAGAFWWGTSENGVDFDERGPFEGAVPGPVRVALELEAGDVDAEVVVSSINQREAEPLCPASSLVDDFATLTPRWQVDEQGDCAITIAGQAELGYSAQAFCALTTREHFDLGDSAFAVELAEVGDCRPEPVTRVTLAGGEELELFCRDDAGQPELVAGSSVAGELAEVAFDPTGHRFVRIRHDPVAEGVVYETSSGDGMWSRLAIRPLTAGQVANATLRFYLGGETSGGFEAISFESLNAAP
ncbi:MAG TPA: hypothetical protein VFU21_29155 [Kofleriaceae bacterium]|nr:hypothetical protein [Kofleriaceae bacterium]